MDDKQLEQVKEYFESGKVSEAQELLWQIIEVNPQDETAWLWYAHTFSIYDEQIQVLEECARFNPDSQAVQEALATLRGGVGSTDQEQSELSVAFQSFSSQLKPYFEKFGAWFTSQEGVVKAAVVSAIGLMVTVSVTGCFTLIAALISRPTTTSSVIVTATMLPTPTLFVTPTSNPFGTLSQH